MLNDKSLTGHAVVIGAGVMGAGIAALLANVGWTVDLLDRAEALTPRPPLPTAGEGESGRDRIARDGLERVLKARPPQFALAEYARRVRVGNVEDHLERLGSADWVIEAAAEDLAVKKSLMAAIAAHVGPETVVSSNTSGLSLSAMSADCPPEFRSRLLGTHFFNPPRYMKPLELIPTAETDPEVFEGFCRFADRVLGKRVIRAKGTPGFISTRLGMYALCKTIEMAVEYGLTVEEADYLTGPLIGRPKSGTFRLADVIGLDITARIADNLKAALPNDPYYQRLRIPDAMRRLVTEGRTGAKAGAGFYRREKRGEILSLDLRTLEYRPRIEPSPVSRAVEGLPLAERLVSLSSRPSRSHDFVGALLVDTLGYMADVAPEVADRIVEVDDALIGGFGWDLGPFHTIDALGDIDWGERVPALVTRLRESGQPRFYYNEAGKHFYFDFRTGKMEALPRPAGVIVLKDLKKAGKTVEEISDAALVDLGDGVACLEWRTKMNTLRPDLIEFFDRARSRAERDFVALVIGSGAEHFSAGFDLKQFAASIGERNWDDIDGMLRQFQQTLHGFKYASIPVLAAVGGYTLGGGCEVMLHCAGVQAAFESSIGLPEANVGLIPAGGGTTQTLLRAMADVPAGTVLEKSDPFPFLHPIWDNMRLARFSSSADEAQAIGYLRDSDGITRHPDRLLHDAKERALARAASFQPHQPSSISAMGEEGLARFRWEIHLLRRADRITEHDARIADALARVLCGGSLVHSAEVSEHYLLELEREEFLKLAGTPETAARIEHMLATGKPLKN